MAGENLTAEQKAKADGYMDELRERFGVAQPLAPRDGWPGRLICPPGTPVDQWVTTFPKDTDEGRALLFNSQAAPDLTMTKGEGKITLEVANFVAGWQESPDEDGELHSYPWLVLIDPDGQMFGTSSQPVMHRVAALTDVFPGFPGKRTVWVEIRWNTSKRKGRQYQDLRVLGHAPLAKE